MKTEKIKLQKALYWASVSVVGIVLGLSLQFVGAWTEPAAPAPGGNVGAPINTSITDQIKSGGLVISNGIVTSLLGVNGNVTVSGAGNGVVFPDGTKQITASAGPAGFEFIVIGGSGFYLKKGTTATTKSLDAGWGAGNVRGYGKSENGKIYLKIEGGCGTGAWQEKMEISCFNPNTDGNGSVLTISLAASSSGIGISVNNSGPYSVDTSNAISASDTQIWN